MATPEEETTAQVEEAPAAEEEAVAVEPKVDVPPPEDGSTCTGKVKTWDVNNGYGFIEPEDGSRHVFGHYCSIVQEDITELLVGEKVQYVVNARDDGRLIATEVKGPDGGKLTGKWEEGDNVKYGTVAHWRG